MIRTTHDYVARKPGCGCVEAISYDMGDRSTANQIAEWVKAGYTVDRLPIHDACIAIEKPCTHGTLVVPAAQMSLFKDNP